MTVPGQHSGGTCSSCGTDYDNRTLACDQCTNRHGFRRRQGTKTLPYVAPRSLEVAAVKVGSNVRLRKWDYSGVVA